MPDEDEKTTERSGTTSDADDTSSTVLVDSDSETDTSESSDGTHQGRRSTGGYVPT